MYILSLLELSFGRRSWRTVSWAFPGGASGQETQEMQVPSLGLEDSPGGGHGSPLQDSCLGNPVTRGAWQATVHGVAKS